MTTAQSHQMEAETAPSDSGDRFLLWLDTYRRQLDDPHFGQELLAPGDDQPARLSNLHRRAAVHFEWQAARLSERAELVDAYELGAYGSPAIDTVTLSVVPITLGFSIDVLLTYRNLAVRAVLLVTSLIVGAVVVFWWRRLRIPTRRVAKAVGRCRRARSAAPQSSEIGRRLWPPETADPWPIRARAGTPTTVRGGVNGGQTRRVWRAVRYGLTLPITRWR
jgi:hypothetical protein